MSLDPTPVARAQAERARARARLAEDIGRLRHRTSPTVLAGDARQRAVSFTYRRPAIAGAIVAGLALLITRPALRRAARVVGGLAWRNRKTLAAAAAASRPSASEQPAQTWPPQRELAA